MNNKAPLYSQIYLFLLDEIRSTRLRPGDRLPSENELAEQFGVSRITSKKALEKLEQAGLIQRVKGKGSFVAQVTAERKPANGAIDPAPSDAAPGEAAMHPMKRSALIGVILPDISDTYGTTLLHSIEERAIALGFNLVIRFSSGSRALEERAIQSLIEVPVDGLIMMPIHGEFFNAELLRVVVSGLPLVLVDRYLKGIPASAVTTDNRTAARELTDYLMAQHHTEIAFLSPPAENTSTIEERMEGFSAALLAAGITQPRQHTLTRLLSTLPRAFHGDNVQLDLELLKTFIMQNSEVTAFVAAEYNIAQILVHVMAQMGKEYPQDYAVVCFDSPGAPFGAVRFTHIQQDQAGMGYQAVELLQMQLDGVTAPQYCIVPHQLVTLRVSPKSHTTAKAEQNR